MRGGVGGGGSERGNREMGGVETPDGKGYTCRSCQTV